MTSSSNPLYNNSKMIKGVEESWLISSLTMSRQIQQISPSSSLEVIFRTLKSSLSCSSANQVVEKFQINNLSSTKQWQTSRHTLLSPQVIQIPVEQIYSQLLTMRWVVCKVVYTSKTYFADDLPYELPKLSDLNGHIDFFDSSKSRSLQIKFTASDYYMLHCLQDRYTFKSFDTNDSLDNLSKLSDRRTHWLPLFKRPRWSDQLFQLKKSEFEFSGVAIHTARGRLYTNCFACSTLNWMKPDQKSAADLPLDEQILLRIKQSVISIPFPEPIFVRNNNIALDIK